MEDRIQDCIERTPFVDTHEHLIEEKERIAGSAGDRRFPCDDWSFIFQHYLSDDLIVAGMPADDRQRFFAPDTPTEAKYRLLAPWWERAKHTGYAQAVRLTLRDLYGEPDLTEQSAPRIAEKYRDMVRPGFYRHILRDRCNIEYCQVNSLQSIFCETEQPDLLRQDLSTLQLSTAIDIRGMERAVGRPLRTLDAWIDVVDQHFADYGPRAIATKNQSAYARRLDYAPTTREEAERAFARLAGGGSAPPDLKPVQDYLFRYCVTKATEYGLPVKLHTGYYAGTGGMPLDRVRRNAGDLCPLLRDFPDTRFVLMHIGYPYQDEFLALAKHYGNVTIDMCWAWIINPAAAARFVQEFLMAVPANKLLTFGGDYVPVEPIYGHSRIARRGIGQAVSTLVAQGWIALEEAEALIERLMHGNAHELFPRR